MLHLNSRKREFLRFCVLLFTPRLTANVQLAERRGSKHDEGALEKNVRQEGKKEGRAAEKQEEGEEERNGTVQEALTSSACNDLFTGKQFLRRSHPGGPK